MGYYSGYYLGYYIPPLGSGEASIGCLEEENRRRCRLLQVGCLRLAAFTYRRATTTIMGNYLGKQTRSLRRHERRPSYTHAAAPVLGPRAATPGVAANPGPSGNVSSTCLLLRAMQRADGSSPWS